MILYTSNQDSKQIVIGGVSAIPGTTAGGVVGPMPRYSINRENLSTGDGTFMGTKFTINVTGTAVIQSVDDGQDITIKGQRQSRVMGEGLTLMQVLRESFPNQGTGKLEISPYGGLSNIMVFDDAKLLSVDLPEQNEESAGVQTLEYSFSFEAYEEDSNNTNTGSTGRPVKPSYKLSSVDESWELAEADEFFYQSDAPDSTNSNLNKVYTLTHTVSATGLKKYSSPGTSALDGEAFRQAVQWVKTRLVYDPTVEITKDLMGDDTFFQSKFLPIEMNAPDTTDDLGFNLKRAGTSAEGVPAYRGYNHTRSVSSDQNVGSYSVTDTWTLSQVGFESTHSLEFSFEGDINAESNNITVNANFQGLSTADSRSTQIDKYAGALKAFNTVKPLIPALALKVYEDSGGAFALNTDLKLSESVGHNKVSGTITYSVSFNDYDKPSTENAIVERIDISYNNDKGEQKLIAILPIIGRANGPIIQDIETTQISSRTITADIVMKRGFGKPDGTAAVASYRPEGWDATEDVNVYLTASTESWNPNTRTYNKSETWEFNQG
tara:strand:- start:369 stop:2018 length:1650 start_codon:yes stop_codon:yes gene_type:complete